MALTGARGLAKKISANGPLAVLMTKQIVTESASWPVDEVGDRQRGLVEWVLATADATEGLAFAEKRPPVWSGT